MNNATGNDENARVMFVGHSQGGMTAAQIAALNHTDPDQHYKVERVVTAGAPTAQVPHIPADINMPSLENTTASLNSRPSHLRWVTDRREAESCDQVQT